MAREEDKKSRPSSSSASEEIQTLDITQQQMFKILLDKLTIIDSDAQEQRKEIFSSLLNQIALLTQGRKEDKEKLKQVEERSRIVAKKLEEEIDKVSEVNETVGITEDVTPKVGERASETETRTD